jgi:hypothetical protein
LGKKSESSNRHEKEIYVYPLFHARGADNRLCSLRIDIQTGRHG